MPNFRLRVDPEQSPLEGHIVIEIAHVLGA